jgi:hypothetical protein
MEGGSSTYLSWHPEVCISRQLMLPPSVYFYSRTHHCQKQAPLASQTANELIFLHDVLPAIAKFEGAAGPG